MQSELQTISETISIPENPYTSASESESQEQQEEEQQEEEQQEESVTLNYRFIYGVDLSVSSTEYYYYPLFATQTEANYLDQQNGGSGTSHSHTFEDDPSGATWYMPTTGGVHNGTQEPSGNNYTEITSTDYESSETFEGAILEFTTDGTNQEVVIATQTWGSAPNYTVDWGDGNSETVTTTASPTHTYANAGTYDVQISGTFYRFRYSSISDSALRNRLTDIKQWGNISYTTMEDAFKNCDGLSSVTATDSPTIQSGGRLNNMFSYSNVTSINNIGNWDVSGISHMTNAFYDLNYSLDTATYDALLIGWASQNVQNNVNLNMGNSQYTSGGDAESALNTLTNTYNWTISDGGSV